MLRLPRFVLLAFIISSTLLCQCLRAQDAPPPDAIQIGGEISLRSVNDARECLKKWGVPELPILKSETIEQAFPFVGKGNFDAERPVVFFFIQGEKLVPAQKALFAIPVKSETPVKQFLDRLPPSSRTNEKDIFLINGIIPMKVESKYLFFGGHIDALKTIVPAKMTEPFSGIGKNTILSLSCNTRMWHEFMDIGNARSDKSKGEILEQKKLADAWEKASHSFSLKLLEEAETGFELQFELALNKPLPEANASGLHFPADSMAVLRLNSISQLLKTVIENSPAKSEIKDWPGTRPEDTQLLNDFTFKVANLLSGGENTCLSVANEDPERKDAGFVLFSVRSGIKPDALNTEIEELLSVSAKAGELLGKEPLLDRQFYEGEGEGKKFKVTRLAFRDFHQDLSFVDIISHDGKALMAFNTNPGYYVQRLLAPGQETLKSGDIFELRMAQTLLCSQPFEDLGFFRLSEERQKHFREILTENISLRSIPPKKPGNFAVATSVSRKTLGAFIELGKELATLPQQPAPEKKALRLKERQSLSKAFPNFAPFHCSIAESLFAEEKIEEALASCSEAVRLNPSYEKALNSRALIYASLGAYDKALADIEAAFKLAPKRPAFFLPDIVVWAELCGKKERAKEAIALCALPENAQRASKSEQAMLKYFAGTLSETDYLKEDDKEEPQKKSTGFKHLIVGLRSYAQSRFAVAEANLLEYLDDSPENSGNTTLARAILRKMNVPEDRIKQASKN